jgi:putative ABC transport system permease protein
MPFLEAVRMALGMIRAQKLKSFFSLVGVLIGVTFLIAVVSIVQGMNRYMVDRFANTLVGANTFEVRQRPSINMGHTTREMWMEWLRRPRVSYSDADSCGGGSDPCHVRQVRRSKVRTMGRWLRTWT